MKVVGHTHFTCVGDVRNPILVAPLNVLRKMKANSLHRRRDSVSHARPKFRVRANTHWSIGLFTFGNAVTVVTHRNLFAMEMFIFARIVMTETHNGVEDVQMGN
jgi:hypothetical protein